MVVQWITRARCDCSTPVLAHGYAATAPVAVVPALSVMSAAASQPLAGHGASAPE